MKIKSITITGMHKVDKKTYTLNDDITYFIGENGSGKSTVLEAIQLAILGYIPGYAKTNESIMKHASGPVLCVEADLDDNIKIIRTWTRSGSSVKSNTDITGYSGEINDLLGQVDLPVFDFNEFKSMTANKLKDWFINFFPNASDSLDIRSELTNAISDRAISCNDLIDENVKWSEDSGLQGVELIRALNGKFKNDQSFVKGQIAKLQGTIQSLIKYDDIDDSEDENSISIQMNDLQNMKSALMKYQAAVDVNKKAQENLNKLKSQLAADKFDNDPRVPELKRDIEEKTNKKKILEADYNDLKNQISELKLQKSNLGRSGSNCPYTNEFCETAAALQEKVKKQAEEIDKQITFKEEEMQECSYDTISKINRDIMLKESELGGIQSLYSQMIAMQMQLNNSVPDEPPTDKPLSDIDIEIKQLQDKLIKIGANKRYNELSDKVTADKFKLENELEVYRVWTKLTDANGLQTKLTDSQFNNLADEMTAYLTTMFNKPTTARFNLISKANSFSFGLEHDREYIEFDYLSSGERCLFTLALIMCILNKSDSQIRTILIDDILDHLDSDNASHMFSALKNVDDIQFILAGVKECADNEICKSIS